MSAKAIKSIDKGSVHRICSGQVIVSLAVAVKELVENSLDAGATRIDVRLKEFGSEIVEVSDNGSGVHPDNFQALTLKHYTSKLSDFSDLAGIETFGFRGEALSSLCALGQVSVTTRHSSQTVGTALTFNTSGKIETSSSVPRQVGTTVTLENLFSSLPVRRKEFLRNVKKEFTKMTQILSAYCLISTGVKISGVNQSGKGSSKTAFITTQGCSSVKENISCIFGSRVLLTLLEVEMIEPSLEELGELGIKNPPTGLSLEGYVSTCKHGSGRSAADRQFFFINSRPCEPVKVSKAVNEIYHQYNPHQYPFVYLNIKVGREAVDVNVTPDKRQVFIDEEKYLIAAIKSSLHALYKRVPSTYSVNQPHQLVLQSGISDIFSQFRHTSVLKRELTAPVEEVKQPKQRKLEKCFGFTKTKFDNISPITTETSSKPEEIGIGGRFITSTDEYFEKSNSFISGEKSEVKVEIFYKTNDLLVEQSDHTFTRIDQELKQNCDVNRNDDFVKPEDVTDVSVILETPHRVTEVLSKTESSGTENSNSLQSQCSEKLSQCSSSSFVSLPLELNLEFENDCETLAKVIKTDEDMLQFTERKIILSNLDFDHLQNEIKMRRHFKKTNMKKKIDIKFLANIDPRKNTQAESELDKAISKSDFKQMEIIGQFNFGFIITKLKEDLFIIDQHAADEKYNFETLQANTVLSNQKLVIPQCLDLTAANECTLMDNLEIFMKNGFDFIINKYAPSGKKVQLSAVPMSRNWVFGRADVDELLFMLEDSPGTMCRPTRVRAMFASRACRSSVMIGDPLGMREMRRLVDHMAEIEQPWNCPHGRPTMRHLLNLNLFKQDEERIELNINFE